MQQPYRPSDRFFQGLVDFSFHTFITRRVLGVLYGFGFAFAVLVYIAWIIAGFSQNAGLGILALILGPVGAGLVLVVIRIYLELVAVLFGIYENTGQHGWSPAGSNPAGPLAGPQSPPLPPSAPPSVSPTP